MRSIKVDGAKLQRARERAGRSVAQMADAARCSIWNIYRIEAGRGQPSAEVYGLIKKAIGADDNDLLTDNEEEGAA